MRVNVDEKALNDGRIRNAADLMGGRQVGWDPDRVIGALVRVWTAALNRVSLDNPDGLMSRRDADYSTDHGPAFVAACLEADLAVDVGGRVYWRGVQERAEFLLKQRKKGKEGADRRWRGGGNGGGNGGGDANGHSPGYGIGDANGYSTGNGPAIGIDSLISGSGSGSGSGSSLPSGESRGQAPLKLEPVAPAKKAEPKKPAPEPSPVTALRQTFGAWFAEVYGEQYAWNGEEAGKAAKLIGLAGAAGVDLVMRKALAAKAETWREGRVTLGALLAGWNAIGGAPQKRPATSLPNPNQPITRHDR